MAISNLTLVHESSESCGATWGAGSTVRVFKKGSCGSFIFSIFSFIKVYIGNISHTPFPMVLIQVAQTAVAAASRSWRSSGGAGLDG